MLAPVETAGACSCTFVSPKKQLKRADGAFNGRLLSVRPAEGTVEVAFSYRVGRVAKGPFRRGQLVTVWSLNLCGLPEATHRVYGLFVHWSDGRWMSGACSTFSPKWLRGAGAARTGCPSP
jgi:hypothetical protein